MSRSNNSRKGRRNCGMSERGHGKWNHTMTEKPRRRADHMAERESVRGGSVAGQSFPQMTEQLVERLEGAVDTVDFAHPNPGRPHIYYY